MSFWQRDWTHISTAFGVARDFSSLGLPEWVGALNEMTENGSHCLCFELPVPGAMIYSKQPVECKCESFISELRQCLAVQVCES